MRFERRESDIGDWSTVALEDSLQTTAIHVEYVDETLVTSDGKDRLERQWIKGPCKGLQGLVVVGLPLPVYGERWLPSRLSIRASLLIAVSQVPYDDL